MYIAMNKFRIGEGFEEAFEKRWHERNSYLEGVPGFQRFRLLRGGPGEFISMSEWESRAAFEAWTGSEAFRKAHSSGGPPPTGMYQGAPQLSGYDVVIAQEAGAKPAT